MLSTRNLLFIFVIGLLSHLSNHKYYTLSEHEFKGFLIDKCNSICHIESSLQITDCALSVVFGCFFSERFASIKYCLFSMINLSLSIPIFIDWGKIVVDGCLISWFCHSLHTNLGIIALC